MISIFIRIYLLSFEMDFFKFILVCAQKIILTVELFMDFICAICRSEQKILSTKKY